MTTLILEVYDAFKSVGIDDDMARKAAGALSNSQGETTSLRTDMNEQFAEMRTEMNERFTEARTEMNERFIGVRTEMNERFNHVDRKFDTMLLAIENRFGKVEGDLLLLKWMFGIMVAGIASIVLKLYF